MTDIVEDTAWRRGLGARAHALFTSRAGGVGGPPYDTCNLGLHVGDDADVVHRNRRRAAAMAGLEPEQVAAVVQVHGADVWVDLGGGDGLPVDVRWSGPSGRIEADALVTARPGIALAVATADCLPIAIAHGDAVAAVHAGWRGLEAGVIEATLAALARAAGSSAAFAGAEPRAVIGPCIGPCCFEVGADVAARFDPARTSRVRGSQRPHLDLRAEASHRLEAAGSSVDVVDVCTACDPRCFSHRRDGPATGRQGLLVWRVPG